MFPLGDGICLHSATDPPLGGSRLQEEIHPMTYPTPGSGWDAPQQPTGYSPYPDSGVDSPRGPVGQLSMGDAVGSVLSQYATFSGRARRSEYWWFYLAYVLTYVVAAILDALLDVPIFTPVLFLALLIPTLAVGVRRLHDVGRSGWWLLIGLVPLAGPIVLLVFACEDGQWETNQWGVSPKYVS